mgnify:FL=1
MSEEIVELLKELVNKVRALEQTVYDSDNMLMKSGFVKSASPIPTMSSQNDDGLPDIAKMDWGEINDLVTKIEGRT